MTSRGGTAANPVIHSMDCALATARATERRARALLTAAVAGPAQLALARDIYARATMRTRRLEEVLELAVEAVLPEGAS